MKRFLLVGLLFCALTAPAAQLPDNIYFRAMHDEMQRSKKQLHIAGQASPLYIAYRVTKNSGQFFSASLGTIKPYDAPQRSSVEPKVSVYIYSGDKHNNSSGYIPPQSRLYIVEQFTKDSYDAVREKLWWLGNEEYIFSSKLAEEKAAVKRDKQMQNLEAEFSKAPRAHFVETIEPFVVRDEKTYTALVQELSAEGKKYSYVEDYTVGISFKQQDKYFLDSEGNFYQLQQPDNSIYFSARFRNQDGYVIKQYDEFALPSEEAQIPAFVRTKSAEVLHKTELRRHAKKAEFYAGPVLLMPRAAAHFLDTLFGGNIIRTKAVLTPSGYAQKNRLVHKMNRRIMSPVLEVFDRPLQRQFNGFFLPGFMPIDDEGVAAQTLHLVEGGKLKQVPTIRSLMKGQKHSNGHARRVENDYPAAWVTNLFFEAKNPLSQARLEEKLLQLCKEQELEYCYILHEGEAVYGLAEKIYTADGRKEPVYGFLPQVFSQEMRPLRDIVAAGNEMTSNYNKLRGFVNPPILVGDMELLPIEEKPDRAPLVPIP